jgi:hypothetical protein
MGGMLPKKLRRVSKMKAYCILFIPTCEYIYGKTNNKLNKVKILSKIDVANYTFFNFYLESCAPISAVKLFFSDKNWLEEHLPTSGLYDDIALDLFPATCLTQITEDEKPILNEFEIVEVDVDV